MPVCAVAVVGVIELAEPVPGPDESVSRVDDGVGPCAELGAPEAPAGLMSIDI